MENHAADKPAIFRKTLLYLLSDYERLVHEREGLSSPMVKNIGTSNGHTEMMQSQPNVPLASWTHESEGDGILPSGSPVSSCSPDVNVSEAHHGTQIRDCGGGSIEPNTFGATMSQFTEAAPTDNMIRRSSSSGRSIVTNSRDMERRSRQLRERLLKRVPTGNLARRSLRKWMDDPMFERLIGLIIFLNVVFMGICADYEVKNLDHESPELPGSHVVELIFCLLYTVELSLKLFVFQCGFFEPPDRGWNVFDMMLVLQSIYEQVMFASGLTTGSGNISFLRSMRLLKMLKMLRVIRLMRSMFELRIILTSIMGSMKSMFWSLVLLMAVLYMFSLVFVQASANYLQSDADAIGHAELLKNWGSLLQGMKSLYLCSTGGTDWHEAAEPLMNISVIFFVVFCLYIAFFTFVILNTITALFVEATINNSMRDYQATIQTELEKKDEYIDRLQVLFEEMDDTGDGLVTMEEFNSRMSDPRMQAFAHTLGIEISNTGHFFSLLSDCGQKPVDLDTFVTGCIRMKGQALSIDLQDLLVKQTRLTDIMERRLSEIGLRVTHMDRIEQRLEHLCKELLPRNSGDFLTRSASGSQNSSRRPSKDLLASISQIMLAPEGDITRHSSLDVQPKLTL